MSTTEAPAAATRTDFLTALLDVIEFYAGNEDAPVPDLCTFGYRMPDGTGEQKHARVDEVAAGLGADAEWRGGTYRAGRVFGAIRLEAHHTPAAVAEEFWRAVTSVRDPWECPDCHCLFERPGMNHEPCGSPAVAA